MTTEMEVYRDETAPERAEGSALAPYQIAAPAPITSAEEAIIRRDFANGLNDAEFGLFLSFCRRAGLHPILKQAYAVKVAGKMQIMIGIDGFRVVADRTGRYGGSTEAEWCGEDGVWRNNWPKKFGDPAAARVGVIKVIGGVVHTTYRTANFAEFNKSRDRWKDMPAHMLAIRAESHALRAAFPNELMHVHLAEDQAVADPAPQRQATIREESSPQPARQAQPAPQQSQSGSEPNWKGKFYADLGAHIADTKGDAGRPLRRAVMAVLGKRSEPLTDVKVQSLTPTQYGWFCNQLGEHIKRCPGHECDLHFGALQMLAPPPADPEEAMEAEYTHETAGVPLVDDNPFEDE